MNSAFYIDTNPIIFRIGLLTVSWYWLMVALAVLAVMVWAFWFRKNSEFGRRTLLTAALVGVPSGLLFSRGLHIIDQWDHYFHNPGMLVSTDGLTIWGAVLGGAAGIWAYSLVTRQFQFSRFGDFIVPGVILGQAIGRIGCTLNGCCPGLESSSPFSIIYSHPNSYGPLGIPTLPVVELEIFFDLALFGLLLFLKNKLKADGSLFLVYLALYGAWRFGSEFWRSGTPFLFGLHQAQIIGLAVMLVFVPLFIVKVLSDRKSGALSFLAE